MTVLEEIKSMLPKDAISEVAYEGSEIILYTKSKEFFRSSTELIKSIVNKVKKRVEVRADPSILVEESTTDELIRNIVPKDAGIKDIYFEPEFAKVVIHTEKPGLVIGKSGETLIQIRNKTLWTPDIKRAPAIDSEVIRSIRKMLHKEVAYRKKFMNELGKKIYSPSKEVEWIRITALGGFREVGRSCILLQTPQTKALLDCGLNVNAAALRPYPHLDAPEFRIQDLDAIILTHAHMDHCGMVPYLYEYGFKGPLYCSRPTRDLSALLLLDCLQIAQRENKKPPYTSKGIEEMIKHCIPLEYGEVSDIAPDMRLTLQNAGHILGSSTVHVHIGDGLYNVLYSLDWTVPTIFINPNGDFVIESIGKVVDKEIKTGGTMSDDFVERCNGNGWKTIAFNPRTLKAEIVPITSFIRHPITEKLYRIRAEGGKEITVTASHNVFHVIDGKICSVKTKDLRPGQFILSAKHLPIEERVPVIDLTPYTYELRLKLTNDEIRSKILELRDHARALYPENYDEILAYAESHYSGAFIYEIARKYKRKPLTIRKCLSQMGINGHPRRGHTLPSKLSITPDLARFIGYYVAEGHSRENGVRITNFDKNVLEDCIDICKAELGIEGKIHNETVAIFDSKQLEFILKKVLGCGDSAYSKRVPKVILQAPSNIIWEFLRGYYIGDGNLRVRETGCVISANSKNPELIRDIASILARFGIVPSLEFNRTSGMYMAHVNSIEKIAKMLPLLNIQKWNDKFAAKIRKKTRADISNRIPIGALTSGSQIAINKTQYQSASSVGVIALQKLNLQEAETRLLNSCFSFAKIISIEEVQPTSEYVYDLSVEDYENFLTGQGFIFVHNTGDMKYERTKLFDMTSTDYTRAEALIIESTYGSHEDVLPLHRDGEAALIENIKKAIARGGRAIIPSFAVGRAQDVIAILADSDIDAKMYLDGMLWDATAIHTAYPEFMSRNMQMKILHKGKNPFIDERFKGIGSQKERQEVLNSTHPCVVLATSGMLTGGPALEYLRHFASDPKNMLLFVGYQAEGTMGRRIQKGWKQLQMDNGKLLDLSLEVVTTQGLSGHSDHRQLLAFIQNLKNKPRKVIIDHGEAAKCVELARMVHKMFKIESVAPRVLETIRLL